jgi:hypothetical protein
MKKLLVVLLLAITCSSFSQYTWKENVLNMSATNGYGIKQDISILVYDYDSILLTKQYKLWLADRSLDKEYTTKYTEYDVVYLLLVDIFEISMECVQSKIDNPVTVKYDDQQGVMFLYTEDGVTDIVVCYFIKYRDYSDNIVYRTVYSTIYIEGDVVSHSCILSE